MFSHHELHELNDAVVALHGSTDLTTWAQRSIDLVRMAVDSDFYGLSVSEGRYSHVAAVWEPEYVDFGSISDVFETIQHHHPLYSGWQRAGTRETAMRISDCIESERWQENPVYREVFIPFGFKNQMGVWSDLAPGHHIEIGCNRTGSDFAQRDRERLNFVRPHVAQAYLNWYRSAQLRGLPPAPILLLQQNRLRSATLQRGEREPARTGVHADEAAKLTPKEQEVLAWLGEGKSNGEIGAMIGISPRTVKKHVEHIFQKLGVTSRLGAAVRLQEMRSVMQRAVGKV